MGSLHSAWPTATCSLLQPLYLPPRGYRPHILSAMCRLQVSSAWARAAKPLGNPEPPHVETKEIGVAGEVTHTGSPLTWVRPDRESSLTAPQNSPCS